MERFPSITFQAVFNSFIYSLIFLAGPGKIDFTLAQQTHHSRSSVGNSTVAIPSTSPINAATTLFEWAAGPWGDCGGKENTNFCGQSRDVFCVYIGEIRTQVPFYFCDGIPRPLKYRQCLPCPENCVVGPWGVWSDWSGTCKPANRYRTRTVLRAPRFGGKECGELSQTERDEELPDCRVELTMPVFKWRIGEWTSCRQPSSAGPSSCAVGQRYRQVDCVDDIGETVEGERCLQNGESEVENSLQTVNFEPPRQEICTVPCDCLVSLWSAWQECSVTCHDPISQEVGGHRMRTRRVLRAASNGGLPCPPLADHQPCLIQNMTTCPQYEWYLQDWQQCRVTHNSSATCGAGIETRQVFCIDSGSNVLTPVADEFCFNSDSTSIFKPVANRACYLDCPVDCEVGHWTHWSSCTKSCGEGAVQMRYREVLVETLFDGQECPPLVELRACEAIECAWWHIGRWTKCFLNRGYDDCGPGTRHRAVYCINALNRRVDASFCAGKTKPDRQGTCRVPCAEDCVVNEWSDWGDCSVSCGPNGGVRKRTRRIVAYPFNKDLNPCLPEDELTQTKPCNLHVSCHTYSWQATAWGECQVNATAMCGEGGPEEGGCLMNGTASCGEGIGYQSRSVVCEEETGFVADPSQCDVWSEPARSRPCDKACPQDCELSPWSTWSSCSASCGLHAMRTRTKHVLTLPVNGGLPCPQETDENGIITQFTPCIDIEPCYTFQWVTGGWSVCQVIGSSCGRGLQTREVHCGRSDGLVAEDGMCLQDFRQPPPTSTQRCYVPCGGDCLLSEWSEFGPCQSNCGTESLRNYCRMRTRDIVGVSMTDSLSELCPHIADSDLHEFLSCGLQSSIYSWTFGPWTTCLLPEGMQCGAGKQSRAAICIRNDYVQVADLFCPSLDPSQTGPLQEHPCTVQCSIDCEVTQWSNWSSCSQACGQGERTRMREITMNPVQGGRACPLLTDTQMCFERSCDLIEWEISEWAPCLPTDLKTNCGAGTQSRSISCPAGAGNESLCQGRTPRPPLTQACHLPCQGECVFSEWSAFTSCSQPCMNAKKSRSRIVIRPDAELQPCIPIRQTEACSQADCLASVFTLATGEWSTCRPIQGECGRGTRFRTLNCVNAANIPVTMDRCQHANITTHETCMVECPIDCQLGAFTPWSSCSATCGTDGITFRTRKIVTRSSGHGRRCQDAHSLNETRPCNIKPCFTYKWHKGNWSGCQFDTKAGCGVGHETRLVECQRSDGLTVDWEYCYMNAMNYDVVNPLGSAFNRSSLDLATSRKCTTWCPGDCLVSEWSPYTSCTANCFNSSISGQKTRMRVVTSPPVMGGKPCTTNLISSRPCPAVSANCPVFRWTVGKWDKATRSRDIWCETLDASGNILIVEGGCDETVKPPSSLDCVPDCTSLGSYCDNGVCKCSSGFLGNGRTCYPSVGCIVDDHCPFPHTMCSKERECICQPGYYSVDGMLKCVPEDVIVTTSGGIETNDADSNTSLYHAKRGTWKWVVGAVCMGVIILAAILCGVLVYRFYHTGEVHFEPIPNSTNYRRSFRSSMKTRMLEETAC
ncbi:thrombospondin type-1 domain-containing protein 7A-like [Lytechinus variegatus]|uniref:thrombospondin type-1 domain-containing protein 7A-like n=1 Tax=Lytechinus variegatus TaxID=7654 RepID=UPI001BB165B5|nr:thrombospondin type-1 domain-containing protein 7A-like [Lytechinus variegatus]